MVLISNQFVADLERLAALERDYSIDSHQEIKVKEIGLNTKYNTVQQIEMDDSKKQNKKGPGI